MNTTFNFVLAYVFVDALCFALTAIMLRNVTRDSGSETQVHYFTMLLRTYLAFVAFDAVWAIVAYGGFMEPGSLVPSIVNGINLTLIALAGYYWMFFTLAYFDRKITDSRKAVALAAIPVVLIPLIHTVGYITGQNVTFLPDGGLEYGIAHTAIICIQMSYVLAPTIVAIREHRRATSRSKKLTCLAFMAFMVPFVVAGIIDAAAPGMPGAAAAIMVSLTVVMMSLQRSRVSSDVLTKLNNRRRADEFLEDSMKHASPEHPLHLFLIDLNRFKSINDTYGHLEGDRALRIAADALRTACAQVNAFVARWGGDEFVVIFADDADGDSERIPSLIRDTLSDTAAAANVEYELTCSIGHATCTSPTESISALVARADEMLYEVKRARR